MRTRSKYRRILIAPCNGFFLVFVVVLFVNVLGLGVNAKKLVETDAAAAALDSSSLSFSYKQNEIKANNPDAFIRFNELKFEADSKSSPATMTKSSCCEDVMIIDSSVHPEGYLKAPPLYDEMNEPKNSNKIIECIYKFYGKEGERIQLFYEDFDLYYPYDIYKFNKIDCRYSDSICLKFYENSDKSKTNGNEKSSGISALSTSKFLKFPPLGGGGAQNPASASAVSPALSQNIEQTHNYDLCNCINVSYTPRQIMSASNFIQVRFRTVKRSFDSSEDTMHSRKPFRGYLIRYKFTKDYGLDVKESGELDRSGSCKMSFHSANRRSGYFSSPNYPGLYPRDIECHYYFMGQENEKVQITFHTFDVEGVDQCRTDTKSDYVELSNFQNRDRFYSRFCGLNKPGSILSDGRFFHVTFYSNNVFDAKGFQASYYFISNAKQAVKHKKTPPSTNERNMASQAISGSTLRNVSGRLTYELISLVLLININFYIISYKDLLFYI